MSGGPLAWSARAYTAPDSFAARIVGLWLRARRHCFHYGIDVRHGDTVTRDARGPTRRSIERAPAGTPSGDADAVGGWPPSLTFAFAFTKPDMTATTNHHRDIGGGVASGATGHADWSCRKKRKDPQKVIQSRARDTDPALASCHLFRLLSFFSAVTISSESEPDGPANGRQPARRVAMRTSRVAGSRR